MNSVLRPSAPTARCAAYGWAMAAVSLWAATSAQAAFTYSVGQQEVIYSASQRRNLGLGAWPDGNIGVVPLGNGQYDFYAANGTSGVKTTGTLTSPGGSKKSVNVWGLQNSFNYLAGGPVYYDSASGRRLMIYHGEQHGAGQTDFYSVLGMAVSTDAAGLNFHDLGLIVKANVSYENRPHSIDVGGGSFAVMDDYMYVYYRDYLQTGGSAELAVARAPLSSVLSGASSFQATQFTKYYNGGWSEPGLGGRSSALEIGNPANAWSSVSYNSYLDGLVMVSSQWNPSGGDLYMSTSSDGINWTTRQPIAVQAGEQFYPTLVGLGSDPTVTGRTFYAYYTDSLKGAWNRWDDAQLVRRLITLDPPQSPGSGGSDPNAWQTVASFKDDFQTGQPAPGWKYAWSASGKLGDPSKYAPLQWSSVQGAYNTTGGVTPSYNGKSHNDDYLMLASFGGHPGRPGYDIIAGYTLQVDDGAGLYRLTGGTIQKWDDVSSSGEDGLDLSVYVNSRLVGPLQTVLANGAVTHFARELGELAVGDTVYVTVGAGKNQNYDFFKGFDFQIQRYAGGPTIPPVDPPPVDPPPVDPPPVDPPPVDPPPLVWQSFAGFKQDFQTGGPAAGWKYLWNPTGKLGDASKFAPLAWSDVAGVYNTTGTATQAYDGKVHNDDYLMLASFGGHPGRPGFNVIAGYTVQAEDGAGEYRLVDGSIRKFDNQVAKGEDGLQLWVYVNDTLVGPMQSVSVDGLATMLTRDLGQLLVGDTIYVAVGAAKNQLNDFFVGFDFRIQKLVPTAAASVAAVPEPAGGVLALAALLCLGSGKRPQRSTAEGERRLVR